jgi:poly(hydroxyalkanoate) depolymerase family esterase
VITLLNQETLREATRLTRAGLLTEATALLQQMLRGQAAPTAASQALNCNRLASRAPLTIDLEADDVSEINRAPGAQRPTERPRSQRPLFDRAKDGTWLGLRGAKYSPATAKDIAPAGTKFVEGAYSNPAGSRTYKLFVPSGYHGKPLPLVVMLHGCTQSPDDFAAGTRMNFIAEEQSCFVVYPAQRSDANPSKCWNWFRAADQCRDEGEPSLIAGITRQVMQDYSVDPKRVYVAGLSAGGAAAAIMGATYSDIYAAVGIHSGLPYGAATDMPAAFAAMRTGVATGRRAALHGPRVPSIIFHGDRDSTVHPDNGAQALQQSLAEAKTQKTVQRGRVPGGHRYTRTIYAKDGREDLEHWSIHGAGHAWSGGSAAGSYTDPQGPDATKEMVRFFLANPQR